MDPMNSAVAHHRAGRLRQAASGYVSVLKGQPEHADALQLLGLVMHRLGHADEALDLLDRALASDKRHAAAWANRGLVLRTLGRPADARDSLRRALKLRPDFPEASLNLARVEHALGNAEASLRSAERARRGRPDDPQAAVVLGVALVSVGRTDEALPLLMLAAQDGDSGAAGAVARILLAQGRLPQAVTAFAEALVAHPTDRVHAVGLADAVAATDTIPGGLEAALTLAFETQGVDHTRLDRAVRAELRRHRDDPQALISEPLIVPWLSRVVVRDPKWEAALTRTRAALLDGVLRGDAVPLPVLVAFALHGFHCEYVWAVRPDETRALEDLDPTRDAHQAAAAMYALVDDGAAEVGALAALVQATRVAPRDDARVAAELQELTSDDASSEAVRAMYEAHPYPRLVAVQVRERLPLSEALRSVLPEVSDLPQGRVEVLVAGAGTGQHPLTSAAAWDCNVLAVDLSRASLARGIRTAGELGLDNVTFVRGDLLRLGELSRTFDVVESVGVLHHLEDPMAGWRVLTTLMRPGGLGRIGLYAERGRSDVVAARQWVADEGYAVTDAGIRSARQGLLGLPDDHPAHPVVWSPDFTSVTGCRDLIFHVREHRYTLTRLEHELAELGLTFLGFQHANPAVPAAYRERWPDDAGQRDLARWETLEAEMPRIFSGMYVFWVRRG